MVKIRNSGKKKIDVVIIGGGFYGCIIALFLRKKFKNVVILEKEPDILLKASYNNQARIHNGYHYPRSFITALRSHINYSKFISEFKEAIVDDFLMTYAIAKNSKTTSQQFLKFCQQIGSPIAPAPQKIKNYFTSRLVDDVFLVEEAVYSGVKLRKILKEKLSIAKVRVLSQTEVLRINPLKRAIGLDLVSSDRISSDVVINCAYSNINKILKRSALPLLPLKHEFTEMPLVKLPREIGKIGITIIDGPFFSIMPFPDKKLHTIHHVRYTPHYSTFNIEEVINNHQASKFIYMIKDAKRYLPILEKAKYEGSIFEVKTLLTQSETTDARPILFKKDYKIKNFHIVLGGKIDNVYDIIEQIESDNI